MAPEQLNFTPCFHAFERKNLRVSMFSIRGTPQILHLIL